jgi:hypothetical protein
MEQLRIHNTSMEFINLEVCYIQRHGRKPRGLWYGLNGEWHDWVKANYPDWLLQNYFEIMADCSKLIVLKNIQDVSSFTAEFGIKKNENPQNRPSAIDWPRIASLYSGFELQNYKQIRYDPAFFSWQLTTENFWVWGLDASGGCIWDTSCIKSINLIERK